jgi:hypothetical protein
MPCKDIIEHKFLFCQGKSLKFRLDFGHSPLSPLRAQRKACFLSANSANSAVKGRFSGLSELMSEPKKKDFYAGFLKIGVQELSLAIPFHDLPTILHGMHSKLFIR